LTHWVALAIKPILEWSYVRRSAGLREMSKSTKGEITVNKQDLIEAIAKSADLSKASAGRALDAALYSIRSALKKGQDVSLVGFGTFSVGKRAARTGRNPRTGAEIKIKAAKVPKFRAGKALRDSVK
jgi:DNA-binding protein HU-beta